MYERLLKLTNFDPPVFTLGVLDAKHSCVSVTVFLETAVLIYPFCCTCCCSKTLQLHTERNLIVISDFTPNAIRHLPLVCSIFKSV